MKKIYRLAFTAVAALAILASCSKEEARTPEEKQDNPTENPSENPSENPAGAAEQITLKLVLPSTKVTFTPDVDNESKPIMKLGWEDGDKVKVINEADPSVFSEFSIYPGSITGSNNESALFIGDAPTSGSSFTIEVQDVSGFGTTATQAQISDGNTTHLKFLASATGITTLTDENPIALTGSSSVFGLTAKLPADSTATINSVVLEASQAIFPGGNTLTINLGTQEDDGDDDILRVYANVEAGTIPAGTTLFVKFNSTTKVYTRFYEFAAAKSILAGKYNDLTLNCSRSDEHAGPATDDGTAAHPYLIANGYQLAAINSYASQSATTYIKMIDDVDMSGITHDPVNTGLGGSSYPIVVNFNGNSKTISHLGKSLFYVFKGSIQNLNLSGSSVTSRGIFAEYCQGTGHSITNVDIIGGSMATTSANGGAMIGRINNGSETTLTITDCDVTNTTVSGAAQTGGLIGSADANVVVDNCSVVKADAGTSSVTASGNNCGGLIGQTTGTVTITDCTVSGTNVTGTGVVGGVVGFANSLVTISGSKYTGGTVQASNRYCGGFLGSTKDVASTITDCQVENATVNVNYTDDPRGGGFVGQLQASCRVEGCTVGTPSTKVTVNSKQPKRTGSGTNEDPYVYSKINVGGFAGVNYGTITKNGGVRSKAYVKLTTTNTYGAPLNLGGFVGFGRGTIEYCDAVVDMTSLKGQNIGGFAGYITNNGTVVDNCTTDGDVTGNNYTGGFVGYVESGTPTISNCSASGSVTAQSGCGGFVGQATIGTYTNCSTSSTCSFNGSNNGGFAGWIFGGASMTGCSASGSVASTSTGTSFGGFAGLICGNATLDKCYATSDVTANSKSYFAGFIGAINDGTVSISRCYATGNVTSNQTYASAFIANIHHETNTINVTIQNCYATGNIINSNQLRGGLIAQVGTVTSATISNCYASGAVVGAFRLGGLIGNIGSANVIVDHCVAWNSEVTAASDKIGNGNWSTGAVVGTAFPSCTLTDNYRKVDMQVKAFWGNVSGYTWELTSDYNHPNVDGSDSSTYLVVRDKNTGTFGVSTTATFSGGNYPIFPYHGKVEAGKTLSQLASTTLGWSSEIWDFSGELPTLR